MNLKVIDMKDECIVADLKHCVESGVLDVRETGALYFFPSQSRQRSN